MELQAITETILQEAKESAESIVKEAQESAEAILEKQKQLGIKRANELTLSILKKAENEAEVDRLCKLANAKITANWTVLSKKEQLIAAVFNEAKNRLRIITQTQAYIPILEKLISEAGIVIGGKELEVILNEHDSTLSLNLDRAAREICERTGSKTKLRLSKERIKVIGGAMVRTIDGKVIMDNTFEDILKRRERYLRSKIAEILFK